MVTGQRSAPISCRSSWNDFACASGGRRRNRAGDRVRRYHGRPRHRGSTGSWASAVQLGTAFLTCDEAGVPEVYKKAILDAREDQTRVTRAFSGRPARGIVNRFVLEVEGNDTADAILPFPLQNQLTRPLRNAAAKQGRAEFLSLWAGQGVRLAQRQAAALLVERLAEETERVIQRLST